MKKSNGLIALISSHELDQHVELGDRLPGLEFCARDAIAVRIAQPVQAMLSIRARVRSDGRNRISCGPGSAGLGQ
jgi:hypothetical protein